MVFDASLAHSKVVIARLTSLTTRISDTSLANHSISIGVSVHLLLLTNTALATAAFGAKCLFAASTDRAVVV